MDIRTCLCCNSATNHYYVFLKNFIKKNPALSGRALMLTADFNWKMFINTSLPDSGGVFFNEIFSEIHITYL